MERDVGGDGSRGSFAQLELGQSTPPARSVGFCEHEDMKSKQGADREVHVRKNVAGGTMDALLGAAVVGLAECANNQVAHS